MKTEQNVETPDQVPRAVPVEEMCASALAHYEDASSAIHHWVSSIPHAIRFWFLDRPKLEAELLELRAASAWVPVSERLPEQGTLVLVQVNLPGDVTFCSCARILSDSEWHIDECDDNGSGVAAWRELPAPYQPTGETPDAR